MSKETKHYPFSFFFSSRRRHTMSLRDWSSDVCSSDLGFVPGPRIHLTAPYITGSQGGGAMAIVNSPEAAHRYGDYWAAEGATWIKAYTDIRRADLGAAIQE